MTLLFTLLLLFAQEATTTAAPPPAPAPDSALVKAAHAAKAKKQASTKKPITNADLKKAKSKLLTHDTAPPATDTATAPAVVTDTRGPIAKDDEQYRARKAGEERVKVASAKVTELEKDLDRVEQSYYNENDPTERDTVIAKRFAQTKRQLEDARKDLADARDALDAVNKQP
jgi:membrane-bound lytic murein transglycosylase B